VLSYTCQTADMSCIHGTIIMKAFWHFSIKKKRTLWKRNKVKDKKTDVEF